MMNNTNTIARQRLCELIKRIRSGDREAENLFCKQLEPLLWKVGQSFALDEQSKEDAKQNTLWNLIAKAREGAIDPDNASGINYVYRAAMNEFRIEYHKKKQRAGLLSALQGEALAESEEREIDPLELAEELQSLLIGLRTLSSDQRWLLNQIFVAGRSSAEIARMMGCSRAKVRVHARDAIALIARRMGLPYRANYTQYFYR